MRFVVAAFNELINSREHIQNSLIGNRLNARLCSRQWWHLTIWVYERFLPGYIRVIDPVVNYKSPSPGGSKPITINRGFAASIC